MTLRALPANVALTRLSESAIDSVRCSILGQLEAGFRTIRLTRALRATSKSQVFMGVGEFGDELIVKRHSTRATFAREMWAFALLAGCQNVPEMAFVDEAALLLIQPRYDLCRSVDFGSAKLAFTALGNIHGRASSVAKLVGIDRLNGERSMLTRPHPWWMSDHKLRSFYFDLAQESPGVLDHVAVGDLSIDHILVDGNIIRFCDLETFDFGQPSELDLVALLHSFPSAVASSGELLKFYFDARSRHTGSLRTFCQVRASTEKLLQITRCYP